MKIYDKETGLFIADPEQKIFPVNTEISFPEIEKSVDNLILSASGWRKIFAANGDEESTEADITDADKIISGTIAYVYSRFIIEKSGSNHPLIAVGIDTRHTGPVISDIMNRIFLSEGLRIRYLFITAAPEIMAYSKLTKGIEGFVYISASHNPIGHNGIKFGLNSGGVLSAQDTQKLIDVFKKTICIKDNIGVISKKTDSVKPGALKKIYSNTCRWKKDALNT